MGEPVVCDRDGTYTRISRATLRQCGKIGRMATVGVIIPAFNAARTLPIALESVASQTFDDWQILLVDDGSTDNTAQMVAPFLERFGPRIEYIKQENRGLPAARNAAIRASTTEFLALLDADDVWLPCRLEESVKILRERPQAGLAYGGIVSHRLGRPSNWNIRGKHAVRRGPYRTANLHAKGRSAMPHAHLPPQLHPAGRPLRRDHARHRRSRPMPAHRPALRSCVCPTGSSPATGSLPTP